MGIKDYLSKQIVKRSIRIENGNAKMFNKIDYIMLLAPGMGDFIQKIGEDLGEEYLFDLGFEAGVSGAEEMMDKLGMFSRSIPQNMNLILDMFETLGFGKLDIKSFHSDTGKGWIHLTNHPVIDYAKIRYKKNSKVCALYRGIFSAHAQKELKIKNCKFIETECSTKGSPYCEWSSNIFKKKEGQK